MTPAGIDAARVRRGVEEMSLLLAGDSSLFVAICGLPADLARGELQGAYTQLVDLREGGAFEGLGHKLEAIDRAVAKTMAMSDLELSLALREPEEWMPTIHEPEAAESAVPDVGECESSPAEAAR